VALSRDMGRRAYVYLSASAATYLFRVEDSADRTTSLGPSFAIRFALGAGFRP